MFIRGMPSFVKRKFTRGLQLTSYLFNAPILGFFSLLAATTPINKATNKPRILVLTRERFRGDIDALVSTNVGDFHSLDSGWAFFYLTKFYQNKNRKFSESVGSECESVNVERVKYRRFLLRVFKYLQVSSRTNFRLCIIPNSHYKQDLDIAFVLKQLNIPVICIQRECFNTGLRHQTYQAEKCKIIGSFPGTKIITHNEIMKSIFEKTHFIPLGDCVSFGALRFSNYEFSKYKRPGSMDISERQVTLFSFPPGVGVFKLSALYENKNMNWPEKDEASFQSLFEQVHEAIIELAVENRNVQFVIKVKGLDKFQEAFALLANKQEIELETIKNLRISENEDVNQLIQNSDCCIAFNSSTMLEVAAFGAPLIVPYFAEAKQSKMQDFIQLREMFSAFNVAHSKKRLKEMVILATVEQLPSSKDDSLVEEKFREYLCMEPEKVLTQYKDFIELHLNS